MRVSGKTVVLCVTGGIAAYKAADLTSKLRQAGAQVRVLMTESATQFIAPMTFETLSGYRTVVDTFDRSFAWEVEHISLAKAADVITYVEHGVCDMGVVGKDTIMEKGGSFYEMVDLGFGKCRFALATKKGKDVYGGYQTPGIATKYPAVTKAFFNRKNMDVETIKIEGSVELAPLLELADAIVDIVETGTTLKENGLEVIEDVAPISARVIVNLASAKLKKAAIQKVIAELESGLEG